MSPSPLKSRASLSAIRSAIGRLLLKRQMRQLHTLGVPHDVLRIAYDIQDRRGYQEAKFALKTLANIAHNRFDTLEHFCALLGKPQQFSALHDHFGDIAKLEWDHAQSSDYANGLIDHFRRQPETGPEQIADEVLRETIATISRIRLQSLEISTQPKGATDLAVLAKLYRSSADAFKRGNRFQAKTGALELAHAFEIDVLRWLPAPAGGYLHPVAQHASEKTPEACLGVAGSLNLTFDKIDGGLVRTLDRLGGGHEGIVLYVWPSADLSKNDIRNRTQALRALKCVSAVRLVDGEAAAQTLCQRETGRAPRPGDVLQTSEAQN